MIQIKNNTATEAIINDLGLIVPPAEIFQLDRLYTEEELIESDDLENPKLQYFVEGIQLTYVEFIRRLTRLNMYQHDRLNSLKHNLSENAFFEVEKENDTVKTITYYTNSLKTNKIREEEIVRQSGLVYQIIRRQYDSNNNIVETEVETLVRSPEGSVLNIDIERII